ncbi:hypothetical protein SPRG_09994 [Saprolegnia parasitica CBS 223.65]|uniref:ETFB lysine methyltransferase n=1 Tax=Saprolegnia parasitica (strain CBS 223.65) TaxID=695850 RepID=A0A067C9K2_SAPPC|nr:hypothetical protein SPRG_09994 [Saprolegnia parasitica CBS 223.65]KDO23186.1 hypothetical protein SPRG_09994 [Saprolegnia parasitica CBS 223.65]|eukprot:XP_012206138.1 hypothetical protein SPRG_09994 [Saprolegnia parasitica CBS 223.65]
MLGLLRRCPASVGRRSYYALPPMHHEWISGHTERAAVDCPHLAHIQMQLITPNCALWTASSEEAATYPFPDPFWAFCWPGSYGICRYLLDAPAVVAGKTVLDFGAGCGIGSIVGLDQGASQAIVNDIDEWSCSATHMNLMQHYAADRMPHVYMEPRDLVGTPLPDLLRQYKLEDASQLVVLAGDVCYEEGLARRVIDWLHGLALANSTVLVGDPGRQFLPHQRLSRVATYKLPPSLAKDNYGHDGAVVWTIEA